MIRFKLTYEAETLTLDNPPEGWNDLKYTVTRNQSYHGLFRSFSGTLRFVKEAKIFIDDIIEDNGFEVEIGIYVQELNQTTRIWENKVIGILNFDPGVYKKSENITELNFEDSIINRKFKSRENSEVAYNRKESFNGTILPGFYSDEHTVQLRGKGTDTCNATAIYPYEAFNRVLQVICDLDYNPLISSVFGRPQYDYVENGKAAMVMLSKGFLMRGFDLAGDESEEGKTNLTFKMKELFENYSKVFNLGLGLEYDAVNERWDFVIEDLGYFYQTSTLFTLENVSELNYEYDPELLIRSIKTGFQKFNDENEYGLSEYNNSSEFATPITVNDFELNIVSNYRADGIGFQIAIDNYNLAEDVDIDDDVFFIHAFDDSGTLKSVKNEDFNLIGGLYGLNPIQANIYLSPARNMVRWGEIIRAGLSYLSTEKIRFNKAEKLSDLRSQYTGETSTIYENRDINISDLKTPRFSGRKITFEAPLTRSQINTITGNPYGLVKFYDYIAKEYVYGWIREVSTDRLDRDTTWELLEAANLDEVSNNLVYMDGDDLLLMDDSTTIKVLS